MTAIDFDAIKPGDYVTARLKVIERSRPTRKAIQCAGDGSLFSYLIESDILSHEPAPEVIEVGDWVTFEGLRAKVIHMRGSTAWVHSVSDDEFLVELTKLTKTTPPE